MAAAKCRQKKKFWVKDLETQNAELGRMHSDFQQEYTSLINEVTHLKNQLVAHGACNDPGIDGWIEVESKRLVERINDSNSRVHDRQIGCSERSKGDI